jgi:signal peptidase I
VSSGPSTERGVHDEPEPPQTTPSTATTEAVRTSSGPGADGGPVAAPPSPPPATASASSPTEAGGISPAGTIVEGDRTRGPDVTDGGGSSGGPGGPDGPDGPGGSGKAEPAKKKKRGLSFLAELPFLLVVAFVLALLIKTFLVQAFYIPSESMDPTLKVGDRVLVNKLTYHFHPPRRGDIIVFEDPNPQPHPKRNPVSAFVHWLGEGLGLATSPDKDFIKRVIGLPGDTVAVKVVNGVGVVYINGKPLSEPYLSPVKETRPYGPVQVPKDNLFVMGDNRTNSNDSRYGLGFIPEDKVVGRAFVIIWPPSQFRWLSGIHYP